MRKGDGSVRVGDGSVCEQNRPLREQNRPQLLMLANKSITKAGNTGYLPKTSSILSNLTYHSSFHDICISFYFTDIILSVDIDDEFTNFFIGYLKGSIIVKIKHSLSLRQWRINKNCKFAYRKF